MFKSMFGKYRFLVISIALFLIFDLGVLVLNFYTSGKIAEQTELINLAGRQRTLTQQMSKATLYIKAQKLQLWVYQSGLDELRDHYQVFGETLNAFNKGGTIQSVSSGQPVTVEPIDSQGGRAILERANLLWDDFETALSPLMVDVLVTDEEIAPASSFIAANNQKMFRLMNELTEFFTQSAERQTTFLRRAQVIGISLATINFFIILVHFLGQLRGRDRALEVKQNESDQILSTISDGVFLLDADLMMSGQHSKQLQTIFATTKLSGRKFERFLKRYFPKKTVKTAIDFVQLYFKDHVDPELIEDVNPLKRVEASVSLKNGESQSKYLDFSFARLGDSSREPSQILVTVRDVTAAILLEAQDQEAQAEMNQQMALLTQILPLHKTDLDNYIGEATEGLDRVNELLKDTKHVTDNYSKTIDRVFREVHKLKGNAAALRLDSVAEQLHEIEDNLEALREQSRIRQLGGREFLPLAMKLKASYESLDLIEELQGKLAGFGLGQSSTSLAPLKSATSAQAQPSANRNWFELQGVAKRIAEKSGSEVSVNLRGFNEPIPDTINQELYPLTVQLLRNAIAHGIESKELRASLKKPDHGLITISLSHDGASNYRLLFEDDGRGFDYDAIRSGLVDKGILSDGQARALGNTGLVRYAFKDAVTSRDESDELAGRGMGLPIVWQQVQALTGKLKIRSVQNEFTQFIIDFNYVDAAAKHSNLPTTNVDLAS